MLDTKSHNISIFFLIMFSLIPFRGLSQFRDLETGDTSSYFVRQVLWFSEGKVYPVWSPFDSILGGSLLNFTKDPHLMNNSIRIFSAVIVTILAYLIISLFLSKTVAFFLTLTLSLNPMFFDALYHIHVESCILPLTAIYLYLKGRDQSNLFLSLGILLASAILSRNEYILIPVTIFALALGSSLRKRETSKTQVAYNSAKDYLGTLIAFSTILFVSAKSAINLSDNVLSFRAKSNLNFCQLYADYVVKNDRSWNGNPWLECNQLMLQTFDRKDLSFLEAFFSNPAEVIKMVFYHLTLIPSTFELLLTGRYSGFRNPDFISHEVLTGLFFFTIPVFIFTVMGFHAIFTSNSNSIKSQQVTKLKYVAISQLFLTFAITATNLPRPEYLFLPWVIALIGLGKFIETKVNSTVQKKMLPFITPALLIITLTFPHYSPSYQNAFSGVGQNNLKALREAEREIVSRNLIGLNLQIVSKYPDQSLCDYLTLRVGKCEVVGLKDYVPKEDFVSIVLS